MKPFNYVWRQLVVAMFAFCLVRFPNTPAIAQTAPLASHSQPYILSSDLFNGVPGTKYVAFSSRVQVSGGVWLRLHFSAANLGAGSYLSITSVQDGANQQLDAINFQRWQNSSAYFNGDAVDIALNVAAGDNNIYFTMDYVIVGDTNSTSEILAACSPRFPSNNPAVGRLMDIQCTAWITPTGKLATAGHCLSSSLATVVEFNVPLSLTNGQIVHSLPEDQYYVDPVSKSLHDNGIGDDWGTFDVFSNSNTGLSPLTAQNASFSLAQNVGSTIIRVTGYGADVGAANMTQQTSTGRNLGSSGRILRFEAGATGGTSGSPVIDEATGDAIGVCTNGACPTGGNLGTSTLNTDFWNELSTTVTVDQKPDYGDLTSPSVGQIYHWETGIFQPYDAPQQFKFAVGQMEVLRATQDVQSVSGLSQKYHNWIGSPDVSNHQAFNITNFTSNLTAALAPVSSNIVIKNELIDAPSLNGGSIEFKDPWLIDDPDIVHGNSERNQGSSAPFIPQGSPFNPNTNPDGPGSEHKGVFFSGSASLTAIPSASYYIRALLSQPIAGISAQFQNWEATGAILTPASNSGGYDEQIVEFLASDAVIKAKYKAAPISANSQIATGWNMISLPLSVADFSCSVQWPTAVSEAFAFEGAFVAKPTLELGKGYWVRFPTNQTITYSGTPVPIQTIAIETGWNLIGSVSTSIGVNHIYEQPTGILQSRFYGFNGGYYSAAMLEPGKAYWIKASATGTLEFNPWKPAITRTLPFSAYPPPPPSPTGPAAPLMLAMQTDGPVGAQHPKIVWAAVADSSLDHFNVYRYVCLISSNCNCNEFATIIASPPVGTTSFIDGAYTIFEKTAGDPNPELCVHYYVRAVDKFHQLSPNSGEVMMYANSLLEGIPPEGGQDPNKSFIGGRTDESNIPDQFSLGSNFPNPFNPVTQIKYALPEDVHVTLKVFDVLGREVATLVDGFEGAGYKSVQFDASKLPSGVYFYRLVAGNYSEMKKMLLAK